MATIHVAFSAQCLLGQVWGNFCCQTAKPSQCTGTSILFFFLSKCGSTALLSVTCHLDGRCGPSGLPCSLDRERVAIRFLSPLNQGVSLWKSASSSTHGESGTPGLLVRWAASVPSPYQKPYAPGVKEDPNSLGGGLETHL